MLKAWYLEGVQEDGADVIPRLSLPSIAARAGRAKRSVANGLHAGIQSLNMIKNCPPSGHLVTRVRSKAGANNGDQRQRTLNLRGRI